LITGTAWKQAVCCKIFVQTLCTGLTYWRNAAFGFNRCFHMLAGALGTRRPLHLKAEMNSCVVLKCVVQSEGSNFSDFLH